MQKRTFGNVEVEVVAERPVVQFLARSPDGITVGAAAELQTLLGYNGDDPRGFVSQKRGDVWVTRWACDPE